MTTRSPTCFELFASCTANGTRAVDFHNEFCKQLLSQCPLPTKDQPQVQQLDPELPTGVLVVFILIAVSSFLTNGFMCVVYSLSREIRTAKHYFMLNFFISNGLIVVFGIPSYITEYIVHDSRLTTLCHIGSVVDVLCCTSSIMSLTAISTERFVAVKYPLRYQKIMARKRCLAALCLVWAYSIACVLAIGIPVGKFHMKHCVFFSDAYLILATFSSFLLPLFVMVVTHGWIYRVAKYQARQINDSTRIVANRMRREFKAAKRITLIIGAFVISWLPFFCYIWIFDLYKVQVPFTYLTNIIVVVRYLNGLANTLIYVGTNREFRHSTLKLLRRILPSKEQRRSETDNELTQSRRPKTCYEL